MPDEEQRCAEARKVRRVDEAFRQGDLDALRAAVDDPDAIPNGRMPDAIGPCLIYAIYHSPLAFIRTLLELGADPNAPADDGFPPLIAALGCARDVPGATRRNDVDDILRLLLSFGADPNQRGINDYTPLHMAVAERNPLAIQILLDGGADPELRTRIDDCETPLEMARSGRARRHRGDARAEGETATTAAAIGSDAAHGHSRHTANRFVASTPIESACACGCAGERPSAGRSLETRGRRDARGRRHDVDY